MSCKRTLRTCSGVQSVCLVILHVPDVHRQMFPPCTAAPPLLYQMVAMLCLACCAALYDRRTRPDPKKAGDQAWGDLRGACVSVGGGGRGWGGPASARLCSWKHLPVASGTCTHPSLFVFLFPLPFASPSSHSQAGTGLTPSSRSIFGLSLGNWQVNSTNIQASSLSS